MLISYYMFINDTVTLYIDVFCVYACVCIYGCMYTYVWVYVCVCVCVCGWVWVWVCGCLIGWWECVVYVCVMHNVCMCVNV